MSASMVERVARAICKARGLDWDLQADFMTSAGGGDDEHEGFIADARAAIAAMREPTAAMRKAGVSSDDQRTGNETVAHIYRAMNDAALESE